MNLRSASESASFEQTSEKELAGGPLGCSIGLVLRPRGVRGGGGGEERDEDEGEEARAGDTSSVGKPQSAS